jgi:predicted O-methyltransferase YrrM
LTDPPSSREVGRFWDKQAKGLDDDAELYEFGTVTRDRAVVALRDQLERAHLDSVLELDRNSRVLDLGGGAGRIALHLAPRVGEVTLVDVSDKLLDVARAQAQRRGIDNLRCVHGSVLDFTSDEPFDAVLVMGVCTHLSDDELTRFAEQLPKLLRPGGRLYLKEPVTTDGSERADERDDEDIHYRATFRPRERYREVFGQRLRPRYQEPTCAHLVPWFLGGTQQAAEATRTGWASEALRRVSPALVQLDPTLRNVERTLRESPALQGLLAPVPVLQDLYVFERPSATLAPDDTPDLSIVVIAYNEQEALQPVLDELRAALEHAALHFELVLVDDGSTDATLAQMQQVAATDPRVRVVPLQPNRGIGGALREGFDVAQGAWITWIPADGQIGPEAVLTLWSRRHEAPMLTTVYDARADAWYRNVISSTLNRMIELRTGNAAKSGGNYLFTRDAWARCAPRDDDSMMLSTAFRDNLRAADIPIVEVGIAARARVAGHSKVLNPRTIVRTLQGLTKLK